MYFFKQKSMIKYFILVLLSVSNFGIQLSAIANSKPGKHSNIIQIQNELGVEKEVAKLEKRIQKNYTKMLGATVIIGNFNNRATGVIVSEDGLILTAAHVAKNISKAGTIVELSDGRTFKPEILGRNEKLDCALLKIQGAKDLPFAKIGKTSQMVGGEACVMVGYSEITKTKRKPHIRLGFVSGKSVNGYLRTSANMKPGDSGGPLFNMDGEVIGICSYNTYQNIDDNYYVTTETIEKYWENMMKGIVIEGKHDFSKEYTPVESANKKFVLTHGKKSMNMAFKKQLEKTRKSVVKIYLGSSSDFNSMGTIISPDGYLVTKYSLLQSDKVVVEQYNGEKDTAELIGFDLPNDLAILKLPGNKSYPWIDLNKANDAKLGAIIATVGNQNKAHHSGVCGKSSKPMDSVKGFFGVYFDKSAAVSKVFKNQAAQKAGIIVSDKIQSINNKEISDYDELMEILSKTYPGQIISVSILRNNQQINLKVRLGDYFDEFDRVTSFLIPLHKRRRGFPLVFGHDMPIKLNEAGTPVINLNGDVLGINIARKSRVISYAIPSLHVFKTANKIINQSKNIN